MYFYFICYPLFFSFFFFNDTATTEIYTLSLHDAFRSLSKSHTLKSRISAPIRQPFSPEDCCSSPPHEPDRKSTRLNSSHITISYAVFCLKKKKIKTNQSSRHYEYNHRYHLNERQTTPS